MVSKTGRKNIPATTGSDKEEMLILDTICGKIVARPASKKLTYLEIPERLKNGEWIRDEALETEFAHDGEHVYKKEFSPSKVNDVATVVAIRVSEDEESFKSVMRLGVSAVEVLSFGDRRPYDATDLRDMLRAIDMAVFDLLSYTRVPLIPGFRFHGNTRIWHWNTTKNQAWSNWAERDALNLLETEREFYRNILKKEKRHYPAPCDYLVKTSYPDEPEPNPRH